MTSNNSFEKNILELSEKISNVEVHNKYYIDFDLIPEKNGQFCYLYDFSTKKIEKIKGIQNFLEYEPEEFQLSTYMNFVHPQDIEMLERISLATVKFAMENYTDAFTSLMITYRMKKKNGEYIRVLRQTYPYEMDENGHLLSNISIVNDISFIGNSDMVQWKFIHNKISEAEFKKYVKESYKKFFSTREKEILEELRNGKSSPEISNQLNISRHTVDTHRRNLLKKVNAKNTAELIDFYIRNIE